MTVPLVAPFEAERYVAAERLSTLIAPPYDVVTPARRDQLAAEPKNIVHLILPSGPPDPYASAARTLSQWRSRGVLSRDRRPSVSVLRQEFATQDGKRYARTGVIGGVAVEPFSTGRVRPHERTHAGPKEDRLALLRATQSMFEALLFFARDDQGTLQRVLLEVAKGAPTTRASLDNVALTIWNVDGDQASEIAAAAGRGCLYVGDGHHRYETAVQYSTENPKADRLPGLVVPLGDPGLVVLPTHRLLYGESIDSGQLVEELGRSFEVRELPSAESSGRALAQVARRGTGCLVVVQGPRVFSLVMQQGHGERFAGADPSVAALDVARVDETVIPILVDRIGGHRQTGYDSDAARAIAEVREGHAAAAVLLNATKVDQVLAVADAGAVMPQKSTYFTPKVPSGIVGIDYAS